MGSTGEPDRKRRHLSSVSPTAAAAKKQPFLPFSEDKKIDTAVLQYQNQKLVQQLEAQKAECSALESKFCQQKEKQCDYDDTLQVVNRSWEQLVDDLESCSIRTRSSVGRRKCASHSSVQYKEASLHGNPNAALWKMTWQFRLLDRQGTVWIRNLSNFRLGFNYILPWCCSWMPMVL